MVKTRITITIDKILLNWIDSKIKDKIFANRSHAVEYLTNNARKQMRCTTKTKQIE